MKVFAELEVEASKIAVFFEHILGHDSNAKVTVNHPAPPASQPTITVGKEHPEMTTGSPPHK